MHTHTHHTHTQIYTHTYAHTHITNTCTHTHIHAHTNTSHKHTHTHKHMYRNSLRLMQSSSYIHSIIVVIIIKRRRRRRMVVGKNSIVSCHRWNSLRAPPSSPLELHGRHRKGMVFAQTHRKCMTRSQERDCMIYKVGQHQQK